jgi:hypothetical protein
MSGVAALKSIVRPGAPVRAQALAERLEEIRAAGLVHRASEHVGGDVEQVLPVASALRALLPGGSLRRGGTLSIATASASTATDSASADTTGAGSTSLLLGLLAEASATGSWCAVVGLRSGVVAARGLGVAVERSRWYHPGADWAGVVALLDGSTSWSRRHPAGVAPDRDRLATGRGGEARC